MGTSERTFNQVKAILGKLDRSIDQVREQRTRGTPAPAPTPAAAPAPATAAPPPAPAATANPAGRSGFGRAQPLRLEGDNATGNWVAPTPRRAGNG